MQKALTEMNVPIATVWSDLSGVTGMKIMRAIVGGERDGKKPAEFRDPNVTAGKETIAKSLEGAWLREQVAILQRQLADWDHVQKQMADCDQDLAALMKKMPAAEGKAGEPALPAAGKTGKRKRKKASKNQPNFDIEPELKRMAGVDPARMDGIQAMTIQTVIAEAGLDMSKWPTEHPFVSWIGLAPRSDIGGGKALKKKTRKVVSRLATAMRMAASTRRESGSYPGAQFRRLRGRLGPPKAITAMAAKLSRLVYRMLKYGPEYIDKGTVRYEEKYRQQRLKLITKQAAQQGFALVPLVNPA
jgi:hypothetical protein